ncbi:MAG: membrane protein insertion efficiency factor YidD [Propionibacteriaceae bacterium]|jgi:putative membrane protein insertion efficiency factor|nr:membrane protein insertion efficiency factor YidD [Propionibacteriaceae bacterium]
MKWLLIGFIKAWRAIVSPWYGNICKYYPTCSAYGLEAVQVHGALKGAGLIIWRLLRCNPWSMGGYDPVPGTKAARAWQLEQAGMLGPQPVDSPINRGMTSEDDDRSSHLDCTTRRGSTRVELAGRVCV